MRDAVRRVLYDTHLLEVLDARLLADGRDRLESREEVARRHYWIAAMTQREGLDVDWEYTALRMVQALLGLHEASLPEGDQE